MTYKKTMAYKTMTATGYMDGGAIEFSLESSAKAAGRARALFGREPVDRLKLASHLRVRSSLVTDGIWAAYLEGYIAGS